MAKHKAPTSVTIAPTEEAGLLQQWVDRHWKTAALIAVVVVAFVLFRTWKSGEAAAQADLSWNTLRAEVDFGSGFSSTINAPNVGALARLADEERDSEAGPWAKALEVQRHVSDNSFDAALVSLGELEETWPDHPVLTTELAVDDTGESTTLGDHLRARMASIETWEGSHPTLFSNPALPADAKQVRLHTSKGSILLGLDHERAPKHVENFLKLCRDGFYDGTLFHRVVGNFMIQGGDPNTREGDPSTWGQGGPDYKIEPEIGELRHFRHVLAAAKMTGETESSGSQFYITTGEPHYLDGQHTVFGALLEGSDVVAEIESGPVEGDRPLDPIRVDRVEILGE